VAEAPIELLEQVPLFQGLPHETLERIARSFKQRRVSAGDHITSEGAGGAGFFIIGEGTASVDVHGEPRGQLGPGDYFGEIAIFNEGPRTATVTALRQTETLLIPRRDVLAWAGNTAELRQGFQTTIQRRLEHLQAAGARR
jgi:CRP-like cAMP-binding protein